MPGPADTARILLLYALLLLPTAVIAEQAGIRPALVEATDLAVERAKALREDKVILLLVSQDHCPFCHQIKREVLRPMIASGDYRDALIIRELFIDTGEWIKDFNGQMVDAAEFAHGYGVDLTPTLLFLAPDGSELTERLVGIQTPDFFYYYVEQSVNQAIAARREDN